MSDGMRIKVAKNGPYTVFGRVPLNEETIKVDAMGRAEKWVETKRYYPNEVYVLCRCGKSADKPFCTGDHVNFDGAETAKRNTFDENAETYPGCDGVELLQDPVLCVGAGFCHARQNVGRAVRSEKTLDAALQQTYDCPGGSLVIKINGEKQEPRLEKSITAVVTKRGSGPLWVKGGIPIEAADGHVYETRNRVALCGCGRSGNKPFCDGAHLR